MTDLQSTSSRPPVHRVSTDVAGLPISLSPVMAMSISGGDGGAKDDTTSTSRRARGDRGDVMLMAVILVMFLMVGSWAMVSSGEQWGARRDAQAAAAAAARAAGQVSEAEIYGGITLDLAAAQARADRVMAASGYTGTVSIDGLTVTVVATRRVDYSFPAPGFARAATGRASAVATQGVRGDEGGG